MIITLKGANFTTNIGTLDTYSIRFVGSGVTNSNTSVDRESNTGYTTTITLGTNYELSGSITVTMGEADITSTAVSGLTITIPTKVTGNVVITVPTKSTTQAPETTTTYTITYKYMCGSTSVKAQDTETVTAGTVKNFATTDSRATISGYTCTAVSQASATINSNITITYTYAANAVAPTSYTFTINPTPSNATVTLTASGHSQSGNSITVPNGTTVTWKVEADGYVTQEGTHTVTADYTKDVVCGDDGDEDEGNTEVYTVPVDITDRFVFTTLGPILASTGTQNTSNTASYGSDYANVAGFKSLEITRLTTTSTTADNGLAFYDADKNYISGLTQNNGSKAMACKVNTIEVPSNAVYCRTTWCAPTSGENNSTGGWATNGTADIPFSCIGYADSDSEAVTKWPITTKLGSGATYNGATSVAKNATLNTTVTIADGYEVGSAGVTVTMGGITKSGVATVNGNTVTISITSVTGSVVINVPTKNTSTGEEFIDITDRFTFTTLGPITASNGVQTTVTSCYGSDYVDVSGLKSITITQLSTSAATSANGLAFYDADKNYISGQTQLTGDTSYRYSARTIEVPSNAVYCRTTWCAPTSGENNSTGGWADNTPMIVSAEFSCIGCY